MKLFISYRRDDTRGVVGRIHDCLIKEFGRNNVFLDIDNIPAGVDFRKHLKNVLHQCDSVIVLIGYNWLRKQENGLPLWDEDDFLYLEIKTALVHRMNLIPVLVDDADMPSKSQLPKNLHNLPYLHAVNLSIERRFHTDMSFLIKEIKAKQTRRFPWIGSAIGLTLLLTLLVGGKYAYDKFSEPQVHYRTLLRAGLEKR